MSAGAQNQADSPADTIELVDGSVISGQLLGGSSAQVIFESDAAGKLSIPSESVVRIESHQPIVLKLSDDRVIRAPSFRLSQGRFVVMTASGAQSYTLVDINKINPKPWILGQGTQSYLDQLGVWDLEDNTDIMVHTRIGITVPLLSKIALNAEVKLEYDSGAPADIEALDQTFKFGLGYRW